MIKGKGFLIKMALKDWKKTYDSKKLIIYKHKEKGLFIEIEDISGKPFKNNAWYVTGKYEDGYSFLSSATDGKTRALEIAKSYMRSH